MPLRFEYVRVIILLIDHLDLWPARLLHSIVGTSEALGLVSFDTMIYDREDLTLFAQKRLPGFFAHHFVVILYDDNRGRS